MKNKTYKGFITTLKPNAVFVYGSNHQQIPGAGAAVYAAQWGASKGNCTGLHGQTYGIITVDLFGDQRPNVPRTFIIDQIKELYKFAEINKDKEFLVAYSGTGHNLNGYSNEEMALMFYNSGKIPNNIVFEEDFYKIIKSF